MDRRNYDEEEYNILIKPVMLAAQLVAIWPLQKDSAGSQKWFRFCHSSAMILSAIVMSIAVTANFIRNLDNIDEATQCALISIAFYLVVIRLAIYSRHRKDMLFLLETMRSDWISFSHEDRLILKEKCLIAFRLTKHFIIIVHCTVFGFLCIPILELYLLDSSEKVFPFHGYFFLNQSVSPIYESLYIYNVVMGFIAGGTICAVTGLNFILIMHGSAKFAVLGKKLEGIRSDDPNASLVLEECVKLHQAAIQFAEVLEKVVNILVLCQFLISTGLVCFGGFQLTLMMEDKGRLMKYASFVIAAILELFMFSFSGDRLNDESEAIGGAAYTGDWVGSTFARNNIKIIMMRARIPSKITAAKFYSMSLPTFSTVIRTSFSCLTVLLATNED